MAALTLGDLDVVLVEPSQAQSHVMRTHLGELGVRTVRGVHSGGEALVALAAKTPHLVLSAMHLPDMSGVDLVHRLRATEGFTDLAFILVSSETRPQYLDPIRQAGAVAILPKPYTVAQLQRALYATLDLLAPDGSELNAGSLDVSTMRLLIVDDSRASRRYVRRVLELMGIQRITEAENGREAVEVLEREFFDVIITDFHMPEMDGEQLVRHIREKSTQRTVPILMVSSEQDKSRLANVEQAGVSAMCDKPFEPATVRTLLERILADL